MAKTTVELNLSTVFGVVLLLIGLVIIGIVVVTAYEIGTGIIDPLTLERTIESLTITADGAVFFGIVIQIGMFAILVAAAYTLIRSGLVLLQRKEKETKQ